MDRHTARGFHKTSFFAPSRVYLSRLTRSFSTATAFLKHGVLEAFATHGGDMKSTSSARVCLRVVGLCQMAEIH
jgi:hypothetical protein